MMVFVAGDSVCRLHQQCGCFEFAAISSNHATTASMAASSQHHHIHHYSMVGVLLQVLLSGATSLRDP
jgi:hypothetical protein